MSKLTAYDKFMQQALKYGFSVYGTAKTGQTISYHAYDDGYYQKGFPIKGDRFVDNGDGTISDRGTGLMWPKDGNGEGCFYGATRNWAEALDRAHDRVLGGYNDWRLPNVKEMYTIIDISRLAPAVFPIFINVKNDVHWTSNTPSWEPTWGIQIGTLLGSLEGNLKTSYAYLWPCRNQ